MNYEIQTYYYIRQDDRIWAINQHHHTHVAMGYPDEILRDAWIRIYDKPMRKQILNGSAHPKYYNATPPLHGYFPLPHWVIITDEDAIRWVMDRGVEVHGYEHPGPISYWIDHIPSGYRKDGPRVISPINTDVK